MKKLILTAALFALSSHAAYAEDTVAAARASIAPYINASGQNCKMIETITFGVNFNNVAIAIGDAKTYIDKKSAEIEAAAKEVGLTKFELQNSSFNVYSNGYNTGCNTTPAQAAQYMLGGSLSYVLDDATKAAELVKKVEALGLTISFSSNAYRQCQ